MRKYMMRKASTNIIDWLNCIWLTDLPSNSKYLACYLRKLMNSNNDIAWPSYARIVSETGLSKSTAAKYLKILESEGWIHRESGNSNTNTVYIATLPKEIGDTVKKFDDEIQNKLKGSASHGQRSASDGLHVVRETDTNIQVNTQVNKQNTDTDISSRRNAYFIDQKSKSDFPNCHEAMRVIGELRKSGFAIYDGSLSNDEWIDCELAMNACDSFDHIGYISWWANRHHDTFTKKPALTNMVCDMNGVPFEQFYDSVYLQECDE